MSAANCTPGYVVHNFKSLPSDIKRLPYVTLIRLKLVYALSTWHLHVSIPTIYWKRSRIVMCGFVAINYARFSSVSSMKKLVETSNLSFRQSTSNLTLLHKVYYTQSLNNSLLHRPSYTSRADPACKISQPKCSSNAHPHAFLPQAITDWNDLHSKTVTLTDPTKLCYALAKLIDDVYSPL